MAIKRFLTAGSGVEELLKRTPPLHFKGTSKEDWRQWREAFSQELIRNFGPRPDPRFLKSKN